MLRRPRDVVSRRTLVLGVAGSAMSASALCAPPADGNAESSAEPVFSASGPNAVHYGAAESYPIADPTLAVQPGEPHQAKYRVGAYSHFDEIYPTHRIKRATTPWLFKRTAADIRYFYQAHRSSITEY